MRFLSEEEEEEEKEEERERERTLYNSQFFLGKCIYYQEYSGKGNCRACRENASPTLCYSTMELTFTEYYA